MRHLKILLYVRFAASKVVLNMYCTRASSQVVQRLKTWILEKEEFFENLKNGRRESLVPSHQSAKKNLILIVLILRLAGQFLFIFCFTKYILNEKNANKSI